MSNVFVPLRGVEITAASVLLCWKPDMTGHWALSSSQSVTQLVLDDQPLHPKPRNLAYNALRVMSRGMTSQHSPHWAMSLIAGWAMRYVVSLRDLIWYVTSLQFWDDTMTYYMLMLHLFYCKMYCFMFFWWLYKNFACGICILSSVDWFEGESIRLVRQSNARQPLDEAFAEMEKWNTFNQPL